MELSKKLIEKLRQGPTLFGYIKDNGTIRFALGSTQTEVLEYHDAIPQSSAPTEDEGFIRYFDIISEGWRTVREGRIVYVKDAYRKLCHMHEIQMMERWMGVE